MSLLFPRRTAIAHGSKILALLVLVGALCTPVLAGSRITNIADSTSVDLHINKFQILDIARVGDRLVVVGEQGLILLSDDQGVSWVRAETLTQTTLTAVYFIDDKQGWAVGHRGVTLRTDDGGRSWSRGQIDLPDNNALFDVLFRNANDGIAMGSFGVIVETNDGGRHWSSRTILHEDEFFDMHLYGVVALDDDKMIIASEQGNLLRSVDAGQNWALIDSPYEGSFFGVVRAANNRVLAYGMRGNIFRSDDAGDSWERIDVGGKMALQGAQLWADGRLALSGSGAYVGISEDNGDSFRRVKLNGRADIVGALDSGSDQLMTFGLAGFSTLPLVLTPPPTGTR